MAETIKGIQVKIEGDTKSLGNALKDVDKNIKDTQKNLKEVNKLLKLDPTNVTLSTERSKLLAQQVEQVSSKLKTLKEVQQQVDQQYKSGDIGTEAYMDFQKQLVNTEKQLKDLNTTSTNTTGKINQSMNNSSKATQKYDDVLSSANITMTKTNSNTKSLSNSTEDNTKKMNSNSRAVDITKKALSGLGKLSLKGVTTEIKAIGNAITGISNASIEAITKSVNISAEAFAGYTTAITTSLTALGGFATKIGTEFTSQMSTVQALAGYTDGSEQSSKYMEQLEEKAKELGATTSFTATEVGKAFEYMAMAGWGSDGVDKMINSVDAIVNLTSATGEELSTISDIVTDAMTSFGEEITTNNVEHFTDVLAKTATSSNTTVSMMGEAFKYVGSVANSLGYSIDDVAVALGTMANNGVKGEQAGNALKSALSRMAKEPKQCAEAMSKLGISFTNSKGEMYSLTELINQMRKCFQGYNIDLKDSEGNLKDYDTLLTEAGNNNELVEKLKLASQVFGGNQFASMMTLINTTEEEYMSLAEKIDNAKGSAEAMAQVKLDNLQGDLTILESSAQGVGLALFDYIEDPMRQVVQSTTDFLTSMNENLNGDISFDSIINDIGTLKDSLVGQFDELFPSILDGFSGYKMAFNSVLGETFEGMLDVFPDVIGKLMPIASTGFWDLTNTMIDDLDKNAPTLAESVETLAISFSNGFISAFNNLDNSLPKLLENVIGSVCKLSPKLIGMGKSVLKTFSNGILVSAKEILNLGAILFEDLDNDLGVDTTEIVGNFLHEIHNALVTSFPDFLSSFEGLFSNILGAIANDDTRIKILGLVRMVTDDIKDSLTELLPKVAGAFPILLDEIFQPVLNTIFDGKFLETLSINLVDMITSAIGFVSKNIKPLVNSAIIVADTIIKSLTENADEILPAVSNAIGDVLQGVAKNIDSVVTDVLKLVQSLADVLLSPDVLTPLLDGATELISKTLFAVTDNLGEIMEAIMEVATGLIGVLLEPDNAKSLCNMVVEIISSVFSLLPTVLASAVDLLSTFEGEISEWFMSIDWSDLGKQIIAGIRDGIENAMDNFDESITNIGNHIVGEFQNFFDINSPSRLMANEIGAYLLPGISLGIDDTLPDVTKNLNNSLSSMMNGINLDNIIFPDLNINIPSFDSLPNSYSNNNSYTTYNNSNSSTNFESIIGNANFNVNSELDIEGIAEEISSLIKRNCMGVGI